MQADPEAQLLAAMKRNKPVISGWRERNAVYGGRMAPPKDTAPVERRSKPKASDDEVSRIVDLFHRFGGDRPRVCNDIAAEIGRSAPMVARVLDDAGLREREIRGERWTRGCRR